MRNKKELDLDSIVLKEVNNLYESYNYSYFHDKLETPIFKLVEGQGRIGYWCAKTRELALSRSVLRNYSNWYKLKTVLKHEMAHQYVDEVLKATEVDPHGPLFKQIANEHEFESLLEVEEAEGHEKDSVIDKINKLLSLANSPNENEAQNAVNFAKKLMKKWNIKLLSEEDRQFGYRQLGVPSKRRNAFQLELSSILQSHFFVKCVWTWAVNPLAGKRGYVLEISGSPENLEIAGYVHDFISNVGDSLFKTFKANGGIGTRMNFLFGVADGFDYKLRVESYKEEEAFKKAEVSATDLVWTNDPKLEEYYKKRYPNVRAGGGTTGGYGSGYSAGHEQGQNLNLRRGMSSSGSGVAGLIG